MRELLEKRVVFIAGKGGVGRTTLTASLGSAAAALGHRVLLADLQESTLERPSSLAQLFGRHQLPASPEAVMAGVDAVLIQTERGTELFLQSIFRSHTLVSVAMHSKSLQRLLHAAPSFREMGMFFHLLHLVSARNSDGRFTYDRIFVDLPATGHALAMTGLPDIMLGLISSGPVADAFVKGQQLFYDRRMSATWVVTLPEILPVTETIELLEGLRETHMPIAGVVVNRRPVDPFTADEWHDLRAWRAEHSFMGMRRLDGLELAATALDRLHRAVDLPTVVLPDIPEEGLALVNSMARLVEVNAR